MILNHRATARASSPSGHPATDDASAPLWRGAGMAVRLQNAEAAMSDFERAEMFYLTEPSRGIFVVSLRVNDALRRFEISLDQLANFLVDGTSMALRSERVTATEPS